MKGIDLGGIVDGFWEYFMIQLDLFLSEEQSEMAEIRKNQNAIKATLEKVRKGTYCEINSLKKVCAELSARQDIIERGLCNGK